MSDAAVVPERDEKTGQFLVGHAGNGGRKPGSRAKLSTIFLDDLKSAWERHGADVLERVARDDPAALLRTVAMLMPKDVNLAIAVETFVVRAPTVLENSAVWAKAVGEVVAQDAEVIELHPIESDNP